MKSLAETNPYVRDPETRRRLIARNARQSSVFEGARGLPAADQPVRARKPRASASAKKSVSGA